MPLYPCNPFALSIKRGNKMMPQYGTAAVRDRPVMDKRGEIARYLKWEYGEGTGLGFLNGWAAELESSRPSRRFRFIDRLGGLGAGIKARVIAKSAVSRRQELT